MSEKGRERRVNAGERELVRRAKFVRGRERNR